jgi:hypothetical protein
MKGLGYIVIQGINLSAKKNNTAMKQISLLSTLVILAVLSSAQTIPSIDKIKLDNNLDSIFKNFNNASSPGYTVTVLQNGKPVTKKDNRAAGNKINLNIKINDH